MGISHVGEPCWRMLVPFANPECSPFHSSRFSKTRKREVSCLGIGARAADERTVGGTVPVPVMQYW